MKEIEVGRIIAEKRRKKGITQDELAAFMGVTKASVSKWETELSYPDIVLLPRLASYFNISIDELLSYTPQLTTEDINRLYKVLTQEFAEKPFMEVKDKCEKIVEKYYSCFPLLLRMAILYLNHHMLAPDQEEASAMLLKACVLCERIRKEHDDISLVKEAAVMEAMASLAVGNIQHVFDLLGEEIGFKPQPESIIIDAFRLQGNMVKARELSQVNLFLHMASVMEMLIRLFLLYQDDRHKAEEIIRRTCGIIDVFDIQSLNPNSVIIFYYQAAAFYMQYKDHDRAYEMLEKYAGICVEQMLHFSIHGDAFFDMLDEWILKFNLDTQLPRSQKVINADMLAGLSEVELFADIRKEERFLKIIRYMEQEIKKVES